MPSPQSYPGIDRFIRVDLFIASDRHIKRQRSKHYLADNPHRWRRGENDVLQVLLSQSGIEKAR
jgi:hypothetical protein